MMNLFEPKCDEVDVLHLYGRNNILAKIHDYIVDRNMPENIAILGVKGVGKTSIIRRAFCKKELRKYYDEANVLVSFVSIPDSNDSMKGFYSYLYTSVLDAVDTIETYDSRKCEMVMAKIQEEKNKILSRCVEIDDATMESVLKKTIEVTKEFSLKLLVVFDDFERFADSSKLKKAQYKFMRELANSDKISLFISTGQDLTKVSEEMKGSGFENIFRYEELRGIRTQDIEDWIFDVTDNTEIEFEDSLIEWIEEVSGGIPRIVGEAAEVSYSFLSEGTDFDEDVYIKKLYHTLHPLFKKWWSYTDELEHQIFVDILEDKYVNTVNGDCLIKKGYLYENDNGKVCFVSPLFELFVIDEISNDEPEVEMKYSEGTDELRRLLKEIVCEANETVTAQIEQMDSRINAINETLSTLVDEMPSRNDYYREEGDLDLDKYGEAIADYLSEKLVETKDDDICNAWNIDEDEWKSLSDIRRSDCAMAYRLTTFVFSEDIEGLDYTPVTVMLGNFLEGMLNDKVLSPLKYCLPEILVKYRNGKGPLKNYRGSMTIGGFEHIFRLEDVSTPFVSHANKRNIDLEANQILAFARKLSECHKIRNKADHPGDITTYEEKNNFIKNMFMGNNSMFNYMLKMSML